MISSTMLRQWGQLLEQTAADFLKDLEGKLREQLGEAWIIKLPENSLKLFATFSLSKPTWGSRYAITMTFEDNNCGNLGIGISNDEFAPHIPSLYSKLANEFHYGGRLWSRWVWFPVDDPYRYWYTPETIERLSVTPERDNALRYFVDRFLALKKLAEDDVDAAVRT